MIRTIASVIRGEGLPSALRRAGERFGDAVHEAVLRARGAFAGEGETAILNVAAAGTASRFGGVQAQLAERLRIERGLRNVALLTPGRLQQSGSRRIAADLESGIREALAITGARTVHFEGMHGVPLPAALRLIESGVLVVVSVHDFSLFCPRPHLLEEPMQRFCGYSSDLDRCRKCLRQTWDLPPDAQPIRRALARRLLASATGLIFPSRFLLAQHRLLFDLPDLAAEVIEPGVRESVIRTGGPRRAIAYAGSVKSHKGAKLLPALARRLGDSELHIFGGGDEDLLRALRSEPNITVHGYYRGGALPSLLARHGIGLVVVPSIVPESYSLVISEAWLAGASIAAFDLGAQAERIRQHGGGWVTPLERGAEGLAEIVEQWRTGAITANVPESVPTSREAAIAHVNSTYRRWGQV